jgi:hypothetical protein
MQKAQRALFYGVSGTLVLDSYLYLLRCLFELLVPTAALLCPFGHHFLESGRRWNLDLQEVGLDREHTPDGLGSKHAAGPRNASSPSSHPP